MPRKVRPRQNWQPIRYHDVPSLEVTIATAITPMLDRLPIRPESPKLNRAEFISLVADRVRLFRVFEHDDVGPSRREILASLNEVKAAQRALLDKLISLDVQTSMTIFEHAGSAAPYDPSESPLNERPIGPRLLRGKERFELFACSLKHLGTWTKSAISASPSPKKGRGRRDSFIWLCRQLADLYEAYSGAPFTRTTKGSVTPRDFVTTVLKCALPERTLSTSTIENLMR